MYAGIRLHGRGCVGLVGIVIPYLKSFKFMKVGSLINWIFFKQILSAIGALKISNLVSSKNGFGCKQIVSLTLHLYSI